MAEEKKYKYDIEEIVGDMDPGKINKEVEMKHREARNKYDLKKVKIDTHDELVKEAEAYFQHHQKDVYKTEMPKHMASGKVRDILDEAFKKQGGIVGALKEAKKGNTAKVLDAIAEAIENEERNNYVKHVFNRIDPQDWDGHVEIANQYKSKFGHLLPKDMKTKSAEQLAHNYAGLIDHHMSVVESLKSQLKKYEPAKEDVKKAA